MCWDVSSNKIVSVTSILIEINNGLIVHIIYSNAITTGTMETVRQIKE